MRAPYALAAALFAAMPAQADDVTDTLDSARAAYEEGDIQYAIEELAYATQLLKAMKAEALAGFLPEAQAGWTRTRDEDGGNMGGLGGSAAAANYEKEGERFTIKIIADSPMVATFASIFGNSTMMASAGKIERVGREKFLNQNGELTSVIGGRILIQANGADPETMIAHLETIDYRKLEDF